MSPDDLVKLRAICEAARHRDGDIRGWGYCVTGDAAALDIGHAYMRAVPPDVVLGLLDALQEAHSHGAEAHAASVCRQLDALGAPTVSGAHGAIEQAGRRIALLADD